MNELCYGWGIQLEGGLTAGVEVEELLGDAARVAAGHWRGRLVSGFGWEVVGVRTDEGGDGRESAGSELGDVGKRSVALGRGPVHLG